MRKKPTQRERVLEAFRKAPNNELSTRYIKRELGITEANGRISELRGMGYDIRPVGKDEFGFDIQKLMNAPKQVKVEYVPVVKDGVRMMRRVETVV